MRQNKILDHALARVHAVVMTVETALLAACRSLAVSSRALRVTHQGQGPQVLTGTEAARDGDGPGWACMSGTGTGAGTGGRQAVTRATCMWATSLHM